MTGLLAEGARTFYGVPAAADLDALAVDVAFLGVPFRVAVRREGQAREYDPREA